MKFKARRRGVELGEFTLEELRHFRARGELLADDYVQAEGSNEWQPVGAVLSRGYQTITGPTPPERPRSLAGSLVGAALTIIGVCLAAVVLFFSLMQISKGQWPVLKAASARQSQENGPANPEAHAAAIQPVAWTSNSLTAADVRRRGREFRARQWKTGYELRGQRHLECDDQVLKFLDTWLDRNFGGPAAAAQASLAHAAEALAADTNCTDPLVRTAIAVNSAGPDKVVRRLEHAVTAFAASRHKAYPELYANAVLAVHYANQPARVQEQDHLMTPLFEKCFADGSFTTNDQQEVAEILLNNWGAGYCTRNPARVLEIVHHAGPGFEWLSLLLEGNREINAARDVRRELASVVMAGETTSAQRRLELAGAALEKAWELEPMFPQAADRMMDVVLEESGSVKQMRLWFDRATAAQADDAQAWRRMRSYLRPSQHGDLNSLLMFGRMAINTGRFDTDVPYGFLQCVVDASEDEGLPAGEYIFSHTNIWPDAQRMFEGYVAEPAQQPYLKDWRTSYAIVAYVAGRYAVARAQLEALNWRPQEAAYAGWGKDLTLMPLEVAARTGPLGKQVAAAEAAFQQDGAGAALKKYRALEASRADQRTREFVRQRISALQAMQR